ncbi:unnamed protein product [Parajaminaea phylloscopi]
MPLQPPSAVPPIQPGHFLTKSSNGHAQRSSPSRQRSSTNPLAIALIDHQQTTVPRALQPRPVTSRRSSQSSDSMSLSSGGHSSTALHKASSAYRPQLRPVRSASRLPRSTSTATLRDKAPSSPSAAGYDHGKPVASSTSDPRVQDRERESGTETSSSWYHSVAPSLPSPAYTTDAAVETASEGKSSAWSPAHRKSASLGPADFEAHDTLKQSWHHQNMFPHKPSPLGADAGGTVSATDRDAIESLLSSAASSSSAHGVASTVASPVSQPSLEWGSHFWVVIEDPKTRHLLFYNPSVGECRWTVPNGTFVLPRDPEGDWLQFHDGERNLPYYWHPPSRRAQWEKPKKARLIIPLVALQKLAGAATVGASDISSSLPASPTTSTSTYITSTAGTPLTACFPPGTVLPRMRSCNDMRVMMQDRYCAPQSPRSPVEPCLAPPRSRPRAATATSPRHRTAFARLGSGVTGNSAQPSSKRPPRDGPAPAVQPVTRAANGFPTEDSGVVLLSGSSESLHKLKGPVNNNPNGLRNATTCADQMSVHTNSSSSTIRKNVARKSSTHTQREKRRSSVIAVAPVGSMLSIPTPPNSASAPRKASFPPGRDSRRTSLDVSTVSSHGDLKATALLRRPRDPDKRLKVSDLVTHSLSPLPSEDKSVESSQKASDNYDKLLTDAGQNSWPPPSMQRFEEFARERFHPRRRGLFKRKVSPLEPLQWQLNQLPVPLLPLPKDLHRDAILCSKVLLRLCGERERPVFYGKPPPVSIGFTPGVTEQPVQSHTDIFPMTLPRWRCTQSRGFHLRGSAGSRDPNVEAATIWQEQRWVLETCICKSAIRDEVFCQLISRLSGRAPPTSRFRAWQFLGVLLTSIAPTSPELCESLRTFIDESCRNDGEHRTVLTMARHCRSRLFAVSKRGSSVLAPSVAEIQGSWEAAFNPSVFGQTLEGVMKAQASSYPDMAIPVIVPFLGDALFLLEAPTTPGMFRVGGNVQKQIDLRLRIDRGHYSLAGLIEAHQDVLVIGSLLKTFFRDLAEPLVPQNMYEECVKAAAREDVSACTLLAGTSGPMPALNRRVLLYLVALLQRFSRPEVAKVTGVNSVALASIFSPTIFRSPSTDIAVISRSARFESVWLHTLLLHLPCDTVDPDYSPRIGNPPRRQGRTVSPAGAASASRVAVEGRSWIENLQSSRLQRDSSCTRSSRGDNHDVLS